MLEHARRSGAFAQYMMGEPVRHAVIGATPHAVIFKQNKASVHYYPPAVEGAGAVVHAPVFISMPLINSWKIWDLLPGRSIVVALQQAGCPVYLLDWGRPGPEDAEVTVSDLIDGVLRRSMDRARRHASAQSWAKRFDGKPPMDAIGYCVGGTFLAIFLARYPEAARRVAFVATPIDFFKAGKLADWVKPDGLPLYQLVDGFGNYPGTLIKGGFVTLKPTGESSKYVSLWEKIDDPDFRALWSGMEQWSADSIDFPGEAYREYVRSCYFENRLMVGGWALAGREVSLKNATMPATAIAANRDHIVPPPAAFGLSEAWGGPVETVTVEGGHVGMCVGKGLPRALVAWVQKG